jgi:hypothetical protein
METLEQKKNLKNLPRFFCKKCDFKCYMKCDWQRHILRPKHLLSHKVDSLETKKLKKTYFCDCNKEFLSKSGLYKHKKTCKIINDIEIIHDDNEQNNTVKVTENENEIVKFLMKENSEFKQLLLEQNNQILTLVNKSGNNFNSNNINSNNKTFNLNMFLNETCKDAMNITDFMNSIELDLNDLINVGEMGYINGISNIIIKNLKELDITQRPIHCTDAKRETLYIKDKDKWEKEGEHKERMICFVKNIANKNIRMISEYKRRYPDCGKYESRYSDQYNKLIIEAMGGGSDKDESDSNEKIIKKISKEVIIDKSIL